MKALGGSNLILPSFKDFEKMGLRRASSYSLLTYEEILKKYEIKEDPFAKVSSEYMSRVNEYAQNELFIFPDVYPQQDAMPIHGLKQGRPRNKLPIQGRTSVAGDKTKIDIAIDVGSEGLLEEFAKLLYQFNWEIPED